MQMSALDHQRPFHTLISHVRFWPKPDLTARLAEQCQDHIQLPALCDDLTFHHDRGLKTYEVAKFEATAATRRFALKAREAVLQSHLARSLIFRTYAGASVFRFRLGFRSPVIRSFQFERAGLASVCKQWRHRLYRCNPLLQ